MHWSLSFALHWTLMLELAIYPLAGFLAVTTRSQPNLPNGGTRSAIVPCQDVYGLQFARVGWVRRGGPGRPSVNVRNIPN